MVRIGAKYHVYNGEVREIYRVIRFKNTETVAVMDDNTGVIQSMSVKHIENSMVEITPDAIGDFMLTSYEDKSMHDVYFCVYRSDSIMSDKKTPALILRQDVYSYIKNPLSIDGKIYVGDCLTEDTMPGGEKLTSMAEFNSVDDNLSVCLYLDDKIEDIIMLIPSKFSSKMNNILTELTKRNNAQIVGYCSNIKQLMEENKFIDMYRSIFNIHQVDWPVIIDNRSYDKQANIILNDKQKHKIEDMIRRYIEVKYVIPYDYDIDLKSVVAFKHILISDSNQDIFMIVYDIIGDYPVDEDIARAMGV